LTTKIHTLADAQGRPLRFILTAGQAHDCTTAADLLADRTTITGVIADKAYDTNDLRELIRAAEAEAVIPSKSNRKVQIPHDEMAYRLRKPHRTLLQQAQTLPTHRHALRSPSNLLSCRPPPRQRYDLDALMSIRPRRLVSPVIASNASIVL
jgi:transposase